MDIPRGLYLALACSLLLITGLSGLLYLNGALGGASVSGPVATVAKLFKKREVFYSNHFAGWKIEENKEELNNLLNAYQSITPFGLKDPIRVSSVQINLRAIDNALLERRKTYTVIDGKKLLAPDIFDPLDLRDSQDNLLATADYSIVPTGEVVINVYFSEALNNLDAISPGDQSARLTRYFSSRVLASFQEMAYANPLSQKERMRVKKENFDAMQQKWKELGKYPFVLVKE